MRKDSQWLIYVINDDKANCDWDMSIENTTKVINTLEFAKSIGIKESEILDEVNNLINKPNDNLSNN